MNAGEDYRTSDNLQNKPAIYLSIKVGRFFLHTNTVIEKNKIDLKIRAIKQNNLNHARSLTSYHNHPPPCSLAERLA